MGLVEGKRGKSDCPDLKLVSPGRRTCELNIDRLYVFLSTLTLLNSNKMPLSVIVEAEICPGMSMGLVEGKRGKSHCPDLKLVSPGRRMCELNRPVSRALCLVLYNEIGLHVRLTA